MPQVKLIPAMKGLIRFISRLKWVKHYVFKCSALSFYKFYGLTHIFAIYGIRWDCSVAISADAVNGESILRPYSRPEVNHGGHHLHKPDTSRARSHEYRWRHIGGALHGIPHNNYSMPMPSLGLVEKHDLLHVNVTFCMSRWPSACQSHWSYYHM